MTTPSRNVRRAGPNDPDRLEVSATDPVPFGRLVTVEVRKLADTRAAMWLLVAVVAVSCAAVGLLTAFTRDEATFQRFLRVTATPQGLLLPVLGVLLATSEWGQRSALTTFTLEPHRERVVAAKIAAAVLFGLAAAAVALAVAALATVVAGTDVPWGGYQSGDVGEFALLQTLGVLQGLAFGMLLLSSTAAIVTYFALPATFSLVTGIVGAFRDVRPWVDPDAAQTPLFGLRHVAVEQWSHLGTATLLWVVVPMALGAWRMMRAEVR